MSWHKYSHMEINNGSFYQFRTFDIYFLKSIGNKGFPVSAHMPTMLPVAADHSGFWLGIRLIPP